MKLVKVCFSLPGEVYDVGCEPEAMGEAAEAMEGEEGEEVEAGAGGQ